MRNIHTQSTNIPPQIGNIINPDEATLLANGWRYEPELPEQDNGFERLTPPTLIEGDGRYGEWELHDTLIADRIAAEKAANIDRWIYEDAFMLLCQSQFGTLEKQGTRDLLGKAFEIMQADQITAMKLFAIVIGIDKELTRMAGVNWWDGVTFHNDPDAIGGAQVVLGVGP